MELTSSARTEPRRAGHDEVTAGNPERVAGGRLPFARSCQFPDQTCWPLYLMFVSCWMTAAAIEGGSGA